MSLLLLLADGITPATTGPALAVLFETSAGVWQDISADVLGGNITRGRQRELDRFQAGRMTLELKNDLRTYDPSYTAGHSSGPIAPMKGVRVLASFAGITYSLFFGYADRWTQHKQGPHYATTTLTATDAFKVLNRTKLPASPWVSEVLADTPVAFHRLGEASGSTVMLDSSANRNHGSYQNSPTLGATGLVAQDSDTAMQVEHSSNQRGLAPQNIISAYPFTIAARF